MSARRSHGRPRFIGILTVVLAVCSTLPCPSDSVAASTVLYDDDFESGQGLWGADNGLWEIGASAACFSGAQCADTVLNGNYSDGANTRLISPPVNIGPVALGERIRLKYWQWFSTENGYDRGRVEVSVSNGPWVSLSDPPFDGASVVWTQNVVDLTQFAGNTIRVAFHFTSDSSGAGPGWMVDDVSIVRGIVEPPSPETFESGVGDWGADNGLWEVGASDACHSGNQCAGTVLDGSYANGANTRLVSPPIALAPVTGDERIRLKFWQSFSTENGYDSGVVQVSVDGGSWQTLSSPAFDGASVVWTQHVVDLTAYAGTTIRVGFYFGSDSSGAGAGWMIDDIAIARGVVAFPNPEDFEAGIGDWSADNGLWEVGTSPSCYAGACAATVLAGNYANGANSRLVSPPKKIDPAPGQVPLFVFRHRFSTENGYDSGVVQVSVDGGAWTAVAGPFTGSSGVWTQPPPIDLTSYAGSTIRVGFFLGSDSSNAADGWYVDEVRFFGLQGGSPSATATPTASGATGTPTTTPPPIATATSTATRTATPVASGTPIAGTGTATPSPVPTATCPPNAECVSGDGEVTTDDEHDGTTPDDQIETRVIPPANCRTSIVEQPLRDDSERGYQFLGQSIDIATCDASPTNPTMIFFDVHRSSMRVPNQKLVTLWVFRHGKGIEPCQEPGIASPAPCVAKREPTQDGDGIRFTILTDHASPWNVGNGLDAFLCRAAKASKGASKLAQVETDVDAGDGTRFLHAVKPGAICQPAGLDGAGAVDAGVVLQSFALKARKVCADDATQACSAKNVCPTGAKCVKQQPIDGERVASVQTSIGALTLRAAAPTTLFVPSAVGAAGGTPDPLDPTAHSVATFACAKAKLEDGSPSIAGRAIAVKDDPGTEPVTFVLGKPSTLCSPVTFEGTAPVNDASHLVCFKAKRAGKRCSNAAVLNAAAPCKREADCGGRRGDAFCQAQAKDVASNLAVSTPLASVVGLQREIGKTTELCLPATID